jgi:ribonuclease HII
LLEKNLSLFEELDPEQGLTPEGGLFKQGYTRIAGVDEAGRGPLAGPVVAAAVILDDACEYPGVTDSKKMTPAQREQAFWLILKKASAVALGMVGQKEIDRINILRASVKAMAQAVSDLTPVPDFVLVDGTVELPVDLLQKTLVHGDYLSQSIGAASIVAKVTRDRLMKGYDRIYPKYGFASHKGYATKGHLEALTRHGPCSLHRFTFARVRPEDG